MAMNLRHPKGPFNRDKEAVISSAYQVLTDCRSGAISIIRFSSHQLFNHFCKDFCAIDSLPKGKLRYAQMTIGECAEEVLLLNRALPELHIHGGAFNLHTVIQAINQLLEQNPLDSSPNEQVSHQSLHRWEYYFNQIKGLKGIEYMLNHPQPDWQKVASYLQPVKITLAGPVNSGKSTFFNWLMNESQALVCSESGTTRDPLQASLQIGGYEVQITDTAGFFNHDRAKNDEIHSQSLQLSRQAIRDADLVMLFGELETQVALPRQIRVYPKKDLLPKAQSAPPLAFSCHNGEGLQELMHELETIVTEIAENRLNFSAKEKIS